LQVAGGIYNTTGAVLAATSGNVGIGTTSPGAKLAVNLASGVNIITATGPEYAQIRHTDGTRTFFTQVYDNAANIGTESNTPLLISTNNTEKVRITSSGDLGVGTTSPSERLHVNGRARIATIDSSASPINMLWADVNGVVRKAPVASGGITGTGTTNYLPKWTSASALGNSPMYDSSGTIKINKSHIGNGAANNYAIDVNIDGIGGRPLLVRMADSATTGPRNAFVIRRNPFPGIAAAADYGTGFRIEMPDGSGNVKFAGNMAAFVSDSTSSTFSTQLVFGLIAKNTSVNTFRLTADSLMTLIGLGGTGTRYTRVDANGKFSAPAFDSTGNAINMLYAGTDGVIRKAPVPASSVVMSTDEMTAASGWTIAYDKTQAYPVNDVNKTVDGSIATVTINTAAYRTTATFNTDQWVHVATVPSGFRPNSDVYFSLPNTVAGASFRSTSSVGFTSYNFYQEEASVRVLPNGNVEVFVGLVSNSADLSGANYVIMPIAVTYNIETYPS
jgi:hypothetical protein